ncbi:MAG: hypothetical protein ACTSQJ_01930 [Promethearchaeota archaeon]
MTSIKPLVLQAKAFIKMIHWMAQFANFKSEYVGGWVEAMGILFCKETNDKYIIADAEGITSGNLVYVETSPQQVAEIIRIEDKLKQEDQSIFAGGWFHSHPGHGLFYSGTDIANQAYWQNSNQNGVGLVFDLTQVSPTFIGFKFFRLDSKEAQSYHEVPYELFGFTEDTLIEAFEPLGIDIKTIHRLALHLGLKAKEGIVEFDKIEIPKTKDPIKTAKECVEKAEKALLQGKISETLKQYRIANLLLKNVKNIGVFDLYVKTTLKLAKLCVLNDFPETGKALIDDIKIFTQKMNLKPEYYVGKAEILLGYLAEISNNPERALNHYKKSYSLFKKKKYYDKMFKAADLAGGISWLLKIKSDAIQYFKDALYNAMLSEKTNKNKRSQVIWDLIKKGLNAKLKSTEEKLKESGIEQI